MPILSIISQIYGSPRSPRKSNLSPDVFDAWVTSQCHACVGGAQCERLLSQGPFSWAHFCSIQNESRRAGSGEAELEELQFQFFCVAATCIYLVLAAFTCFLCSLICCIYFCVLYPYAWNTEKRSTHICDDNLLSLSICISLLFIISSCSICRTFQLSDV